MNVTSSLTSLTVVVSAQPGGLVSGAMWSLVHARMKYISTTDFSQQKLARQNLVFAMDRLTLLVMVGPVENGVLLMKIQPVATNCHLKTRYIQKLCARGRYKQHQQQQQQ